MAFIQCNFFSEALGMSVTMNVLLPQRPLADVQATEANGTKLKPFPVLWLLHGRSDDHTTWMRQTAIERYVADLGLAVVMPAADVSFYQNMCNGAAYGDFIDHELPAVARSWFPLSNERSENFIAGLSMGGYGAMRSALLYPERYAAAASLSGSLDAVAFLEVDDPVRVAWLKRIFGEDYRKIEGTSADLLAQLKRCRMEGRELPNLFACCGRQDFLIEHTRKFAKVCEATKTPLHCIENEGDHNWPYWDRMIQEVLAWLPLQK
jgi:S-formylglutathione hydrolase FrmB